MNDASGTRRLVVVRHAKAEGSGPTDHRRRLTKRGHGDAAAASAAVAAALPGGAGRAVALVSSAVRAHETWADLAAGLPAGHRVEEQVSNDLYEAGVDDVVRLVAGLDDGVEVAIVVGHNPTMQGTVHELAGGGARVRGDRAAWDSVNERGFPTASVAVLDLPAEWAHLEAAGCRLVAFDVGRS